MRTLAIDTSTRLGVLGLSEDGVPIAECALPSRESHSARLLPSIEWILTGTGWSLDSIDVFGVVTGPGSFTGLRVGLATVKGIAWSSKKPVVGIDSLEALAFSYGTPGTIVVPMLDAKRGRVFGAVYRTTEGRPERLVPSSDIKPEEMLSQTSGSVVCIGDGARVYHESLTKVFGSRVIIPSVNFDVARGFALAALSEKIFELGEVLSLSEAEPVYLRAAEAEVKQGESSR